MSIIRYKDQAKMITYFSDRFESVNTEGGTTYAYSRLLSGSDLNRIPETQQQLPISNTMLFVLVDNKRAQVGRARHIRVLEPVSSRGPLLTLFDKKLPFRRSA